MIDLLSLCFAWVSFHSDLRVDVWDRIISHIPHFYTI